MSLGSFVSKALKPVTSLLGSVGNVVGSTLNSVTGVDDTANRSYEMQQKLLAQEYANNVNLWNMQNAYNTPAAQMARMKDAGININPMTYAVGNGSMSSTASSISAPHAGSPSFSASGNPISMLMSVMSGIENIKGQRLDNEYKQKQIDNYANEHVPPWLQIANGIGALFGKNFSDFTDIMNQLKGSVGNSNPVSVTENNHLLDLVKSGKIPVHYDTKGGPGYVVLKGKKHYVSKGWKQILTGN